MPGLNPWDGNFSIYKMNHRTMKHTPTSTDLTLPRCVNVTMLKTHIIPHSKTADNEQ